MKGNYYYHAPAGRYCVYIYWQGKPRKIWKYNGEPIWHEKTADKLLNKIRAEIDDGTFLLQSYQPDSPVALSKYSEQWLASLSVAPVTIKFYRKEIKHAIDHFGKDFDIRKFTFSKLQEYYNVLKLTTKGKYHALNTLKTMLRFAYQDELIRKIPPFPRLTNALKQEIKYLTYEQQQSVLWALPEADRGIFEFAMEYGLRIGEVIALQWDCVTENEIIIKRSMGDGEVRQSTKTGKNRVYGSTDIAKQILQKYYRQHDIAISSYVFIRANGTPYTHKSLTKKWKNACAKVGIKINLYNGLRHSLGCQLEDAGVPIEDIRDILGHSSTTMTRRYAHRSVARLAEILQFRGKEKLKEVAEK